MISITAKSPYAVSALVELHRLGDSGPVPIAELARRRQIPVQFLEQLFATLRRAGVLRSQRGVKGGYSFERSSSEVTVLEVVELLDGPLGQGASGLVGTGLGHDRDRRRAGAAQRGRGHVPDLGRPDGVGFSRVVSRDGSSHQHR
jgi:Rrf2 family transcriptional regulator, cysteine metabolism repressor